MTATSPPTRRDSALRRLPCDQVRTVEIVAAMPEVGVGIPSAKDATVTTAWRLTTLHYGS